MVDHHGTIVLRHSIVEALGLPLLSVIDRTEREELLEERLLGEDVGQRSEELVEKALVEGVCL